MGNGQDRDNKQSPSLEDAFGGSGDDALANALLEALGQGKSPTHEARPESTELTLDSSATISEGDEDAAGFDIVAIEPRRLVHLVSCSLRIRAPPSALSSEWAGGVAKGAAVGSVGRRRNRVRQGLKPLATSPSPPAGAGLALSQPLDDVQRLK